MALLEVLGCYVIMGQRLRDDRGAFSLPLKSNSNSPQQPLANLSWTLDIHETFYSRSLHKLIPVSFPSGGQHRNPTESSYQGLWITTFAMPTFGEAKSSSARSIFSLSW
jgi:hypothetical protein